MPKKSSNQFRLDKVKKQAKRFAKESGITLSEALENVSIELGYDSWFQCRKAILNGEKKEELSPRKGAPLAPYEYDPSTDNVEDIIGITANADGGYSVQERKSILNYIDDRFKNASELRSRLEKDIKSVISNSKSHTHIYIYLFLDSFALAHINNVEGFFDRILNRFARLTNLEVIVRDEQLTVDEFQEFINELHPGVPA